MQNKIRYVLRTLIRFLPWIHKSIYFNFHYLPFEQAVKLPILLYKPHFIKLKGNVIIESDKVSFGMIKMGISIEIGDNTVIAYETMIMDSDWHALTDVVTGKLLNKTSFVKIGSYNFISYRCIINRGTVTPDYCTVTACSTLNKKYDFEQYSLIGGNPCKLIDEGYFMDPQNN